MSIVKISLLFWVLETWSMIIGSLSIEENRILEVFQKVECGQGSFGLPFFFCPFFNLLNLSAVFLLLGASKIL